MPPDFQHTHGLGAQKDPVDRKRYKIAALYEIAGVEPLVTVLPASYKVGGMPTVLDQDGTPQCTAYSSSTMKSYQDRKDLLTFFNFDEAKFFSLIGGTSEGAYISAAMEYLRGYGYPVVTTDDRAKHKIAAYYSVPVNADELKRAIVTFGPLVLGVAWQHSWFRPVNGVLPVPDYASGGHAIIGYGWDDTKGLLLRNSWGTDYGLSGDVYLPYAYLNKVWGATKTVDDIQLLKKKILCSNINYRVGAGLSYTSKGKSVAGQVLTVVNKVTGGAWAMSCNGAKSGNTWYKVSQVNGTNVSTLYGVSYVYVATGAF